jgi:hypothetical protein
MLSNRVWEPKIGLVASLISFLAFEIKEDLSKPNASDVKLFEEFLVTLPSDGDIEYIKDYDMAGPIERDRLKQLNRFYYDWDNAEHEFIDRKLEKKRKQLFKSITLFFEAYGKYTFSTGDRFQRVPPEWQGDHPQKHREAVELLNDRAESIFILHQTFIRVAQRN